MGSRSKLVAVAALLAATAAACANGDASGNQARDAVLNAGYNEATANCVGNSLETDDPGTGLTQDELNEVGDAGDLDELSGKPFGNSEGGEDLMTFTRSVLEDCVNQYTNDGAPTSDETAPESDEGDSPDTDQDAGDTSES